MLGRPESSTYFSSNSMMVGDSAMARRKGVVTTRVAVVFSVVVLLGILMAGRIYLTNRITGLRARVAGLENRREFLEATLAQGQSRWNEISRDQVIIQRAERELGLVVPGDPGLVLVCVSDPKARTGLWSRLKGEFLAAKMTPQGARAGEVMTGSMISLVDRRAAAVVPGDGDR